METQHLFRQTALKTLRSAFLLPAALGFFLSCQKMEMPDVPTYPLMNNQPISLPESSGGTVTATTVDNDDDGYGDSLDFNHDTIGDVALIEVSANILGLDINRDGIIDYYLNFDENGNTTLSLNVDGSEPVTVVTDGSGNSIGFDTDGDGSSDTSISVGEEPVSSIQAIDTNAGIFNTIEVNGSSIYISYYDAVNQDIKLAASTDSGTSWTINTFVSGVSIGSRPPMGVSGSNIYLLYHDLDTEKLFYKQNPAGTPGEIQTVGASGAHSSLWIDNGGSVHAAYEDANAGKSGYAKIDGTLLLNKQFTYARWHSVFEESGKVYVALTRGTALSSALQLSFSTDSGDTWTDYNAADANAQYNEVLGLNGKIYIAFYDAGSESLKISVADTSDLSAWSTATISNTSKPGYGGVSLKIYGSTLYLLYYQYSKLIFARCDTSAKDCSQQANWSKKTIDDSLIVEADNHNDMAVDSAGNIYISYYDGGTGELRFAKSSDGGDTW